MDIPVDLIEQIKAGKCVAFVGAGLSQAAGLPGWPDLPVAMITAYGDPESRQIAHDSGAAEFMTKPIDFVELKSSIVDLVQAVGN